MTSEMVNGKNAQTRRAGLPHTVSMARARTPGEAAKKLKALRERSGLSIREMMDALGLTASSTYAGWEAEYKKPYLPFDRAQKIATVLVGRGDPPITKSEVMALAGIVQVPHHGARPKVVPGDPALAKDLPAVPEIDVRGGLGGGGVGWAQPTLSGANQVNGDGVKDWWGIPESYLRNELRLSRDRCRLIEVIGDSMTPTLMSGDRVVIDIGDRNPYAEGVFALWNGGAVVVKRLEHVPNSDPATFRIRSDNPRHGVDERTEEEINVIGRVVWVGRRLL